MKKIEATVGTQRRLSNDETEPSETVRDREAGEPISNLVVTTKMQQTVSAIASIIPAINSNTNILLLQNGMGSHEMLCRTFWPDPLKRPRFLMGITTHGVKPVRGPEWKFEHVGVGSIKLASLPNDSNPTNNSQLEDMLVKAGPSLATQVLEYPDFLLAQIEKLICNSIVNPLTAIYSCFNGELLALNSLDYLMYKLASEASAAFTASLKHQYPSLPPGKIATALHPDRLNSLVVELISSTSQNKSSMLQDVQSLKDTEIDFINGYIVKLATEYGTGAIHNRMLVEMVKSKLSLEKDRERRSAPVINV